MVAPVKLSKSKFRKGSLLASNSSAALLESARRRRKLVLRTAESDPYAPKSRPHNISRRHKLSRSSSTTISSSSEQYEEASYTERPGFSPIHPPLIDMYGGTRMSALLAKSMPPHLQHPDLEEANAEAISKAGHDPLLALKGLEIVRRELARNGEHLYAAVTRTSMDPIIATHSSELPEFVTIRVPKSIKAKHLPTHVLAVHACKGTPTPRSHKLIALSIHSTILAAHCSRVPALPNPTPPATFDPIAADGSSRMHSRVVPLIPFAIPSPEMFPILEEYLCTQNAGKLLRALVPALCELGPVTTFNDLPEKLAYKLTSASLLSGAMRVYGLWQDACSLGVLNPQIWKAIDIAWRGYREALLLAIR